MNRYQRFARCAGAVALTALLAACGGDKDDDNGNAPPVAETPATPPPAPVQVAFMPDIHFHDIYADFKDGSFPGIPNPKRGDNATIRTMPSIGDFMV